MRSLEKRFNRIKKENPLWSDYTVFSQTIRDQNFSPETITRNFNKLVDKNDYSKKDKKEIVNFLLNL